MESGKSKNATFDVAFCLNLGLGAAGHFDRVGSFRTIRDFKAYRVTFAQFVEADPEYNVVSCSHD